MSTEIIGLSILLATLGWWLFYRSRRRNSAPHGENEEAKQTPATLRARAHEPDAAAAAGVSERYQRSLRMIGDLQARATALQSEAVEETRLDVQSIVRKLERLAARAKRELGDLKSGLEWTILEMETGLRLTIDDAKAHLKLIEAKRELILARRAARAGNLTQARVRVEAAWKLIDEAQSLALGQHDNLLALRRQTEALLAAIGNERANTEASIDTLLERSNRILAAMKGSEAATRNAA